MKHIKAILLAVMVTLTPFTAVDAAVTPEEKCRLCCGNGTDDGCYSNCLAAENVRLAMLNDQIDSIKPVPAQERFRTGTCLDAILNTGIDFTFSVPTLSGIIQDMINKAMNAACSAVNQQMSKTMGAVNQRLGTAVNMPIYGTSRTASARIGQTTNTNTSTTTSNTSTYPVTTTTNGTTVNGSANSGSLGDVLN